MFAPAEAISPANAAFAAGQFFWHRWTLKAQEQARSEPHDSSVN